MILYVHSTLKKGRRNHLILYGQRFISGDGDVEKYEVYPSRIRWIDCFESLFGWIRMPYKDGFIYIKVGT